MPTAYALGPSDRLRSVSNPKDWHGITRRVYGIDAGAWHHALACIYLWINNQTKRAASLLANERVQIAPRWFVGNERSAKQKAVTLSPKKSIPYRIKLRIPCTALP